MELFLWGGGLSGENPFEGGGHLKKIGKLRGGGLLYFQKTLPQIPTAPPPPHKNEWSLNSRKLGPVQISCYTIIDTAICYLYMQARDMAKAKALLSPQLVLLIMDFTLVDGNIT